MKLTLKRIVELEAYAHGYWQGEVPPEEFCALLDSARALARLEEWLRGDDMRAVVLSLDQAEAHFPDPTEEFEMTTRDAKGPDLPAAINAALDAAEVRA